MGTVTTTCGPLGGWPFSTSLDCVWPLIKGWWHELECWCGMRIQGAVVLCGGRGLVSRGDTCGLCCTIWDCFSWSWRSVKLSPEAPEFCDPNSCDLSALEKPRRILHHWPCLLFKNAIEWEKLDYKHEVSSQIPRIWGTPKYRKRGRRLSIHTAVVKGLVGNFQLLGRV